MNSILILASAISIAASSLAFGKNVCDNPQTAAEKTLCAKQKLEVAEIRLNLLWPKVLAYFEQIDESIKQTDASNKPERTSKALIVEAQNYWKTLKIHECTALSDSYLNHPAYTSVYLSCLAETTRDRIETLSHLIENKNSLIVEQKYKDLQSEFEICSETSTVAVKLCLDLVGSAADEELNKVYQHRKAILKNSSENPTAVKEFVKAQRAWISLRDAQCEAVSQSFWGGTALGLVAAECITTTTLARSGEIFANYPDK